jgi:hypothetical protein
MSLQVLKMKSFAGLLTIPFGIKLRGKIPHLRAGP